MRGTIFRQLRISGFTLIEMSIVLVIIGLIVGSVLAGQELIYAARIRQLGTEVQKINTAITTFRGKYDCLPGDCANAQMFFGTNSNGCPAGGGTTGTCNGNGDGSVNGWFTAGNIEHLYAWQQLSLAGLIPWSFPGSYITGGPTQTVLQVGKNIPASTFNPGIGYNFYSVRNTMQGAFRDTIEIGAVGTNIDVLSGAGLTAPQAYALDNKLDDGLPQSGKIFAVSFGSGSTIQAYDGVDTQATSVNSNTVCVASGLYLTTTASGCTMEYKPDAP